MADAQTPQNLPAPAPKPERLPDIDYPVANNSISSRSLGGIVAAGIGGFMGWIGSSIYMEGRLNDFRLKVSKAVRDDILGRNGAGAAASGGGSEVGHMGFNGLGPGLGSPEIHEFHARNLAKQEGGIPNFLYKWFGGEHGKGMLAMGIGVIGAVLGFIGYKALGPKGDKPISLAPAPIAPATTLPPAGEPPVVSELAASPAKDWTAKVVEASHAEAQGKSA